MPNTIRTPLSYADVAKVLSYDPETGLLTWLKDVAKNIKAGAEAGTVKSLRETKSGADKRYRYIRYANYEMTAARVAWLLKTGEWPKGNILFSDGDSLNLKFSNLRIAEFPLTYDREKKRNVMSREDQHRYGLRRHYGLSMDAYIAKLAAQSGVCAICSKPETVIVHGKLKPLSVDHDHSTGEVRDLLCTNCNNTLGAVNDDVEHLEKCIRYLKRHQRVRKVV